MDKRGDSSVEEVSVEGTIVLVLTLGVGISEWKQSQILQREMALWRNYVENNWSVWIISTSREDHVNQIADTGEFGIQFLSLPPSGRLGSFFVPRSWKSQLEYYLKTLRGRSSVIVRTNQLWGAHLGAYLSRFLNCPLVIRQGFSLTEDLKQKRKNWIYRLLVQIYEKTFLRKASLAEFTTEHARMISCRSNKQPECIAVIPNFVDTQTWTPRKKLWTPKDFDIRLGYFGRLEPIKNLLNLIEALVGIQHVTLEIIGTGSQRDALEEMSSKHQVATLFIPPMAPELLSTHIEEWTAAVFPSFHEGHPKAVIETMTKGVPIVGTPVPGIRELLENGRGIVSSGVSSRELQTAILEFLHKDVSEIRKMINRAQEFSTSKYSLVSIAQEQRLVYGKIMRQYDN